MKKTLLFTFLLFISTLNLYSQSVETEKQETKYPEIKGYVGLVHPIYTMSTDGNIANFQNYYLVGNPWGINIWKNSRFGLSLEFTPYIKTDQKDSKLSNFLFHPGVLYKIGREFTLIGRVAYETSGRFGITPILNKVLVRGKNSTFFVALLLPMRVGNAQAPSLTTSFQFGVGF